MNLHSLFTERTGAALTGPDASTIAKGRDVFLRGKVGSVSAIEPGRLSAQVRGSRDSDVYQTRVRLSRAPGGARMRFASTCSCPVALNCKHGVATLFAWLDDGEAPPALEPVPEIEDDAAVRPDIAASWIRPAQSPAAGDLTHARMQVRAQRDRALSWVRELDEVRETSAVEREQSRLAYVLRVAGRQARLSVYRLRLDAEGRPQRAEAYTTMRDQAFAPPAFWDDTDSQAAALLMREPGGMGAEFMLAGARAGELLLMLARAQRLSLDEPPTGAADDAHSLSVGNTRVARLQWDRHEGDESGWRLALALKDGAQPLYLQPPCWLDAQKGRIGVIQGDWPSGLMTWLRNAPPVPAMVAPDVALALHSQLRERPLLRDAIPPMPEQSVREIRAPLVPVLRLSDARLARPVRAGVPRRGHRAEQSYLVVGLQAEYEGHRQALLDGASRRIDSDDGLALLFTDEAAEREALATVRAALEALLPKEPLDVQRGALMGGSAAVSVAGGESHALLLAVPARGLTALRIRYELVPALRDKGWVVDDRAGPGPRVHRRFDIEVGFESAGGARRGRGNTWFSLQSGLRLGDQRVDLAPVLAQMVNAGGFEAWRERQGGNDTLWLPLPDGGHAAVPIERLAPLANAVAQWLEPDGVRRLPSPEPARETGADTRSASGEAGDADVTPVAEEEAERIALEFDAMSAARLARTLDSVKLPAAVERLRQAFEGLEAVPEVEPPKMLDAQLRPYQRAGLSWLQFLARCGLGGVLADDMGLGKTLQVLAHLACEKENERMRAPVLIVAPTSLVFNWAHEAARFVPQLRVLDATGPSRRKVFDRLDATDVVLTSYALLPRDIEVLGARRWHAVIADEAQAIKNPRTRAAQSLHTVQAEHRIALTGTPLENHLGELWSIMRFAMPELLGPEEAFRRRYRHPIERRAQDPEGEARMQALTRRLRPFMLRRTKREVLADLPARTEIVQRIELPSDQRDLYEAIRATMDQRVREALADGGLARNHLLVLDALMKLRQACCDPKLVKLPAAAKVRHSAKLDALVELLSTLTAEGRKALVFSQFTSMLDLIERRLDAEPDLQNVARVRLDGSTQDRAAAVAAFQDGPAQLFLLSLKAGGVGLNLTAADTVIHYDPWWNPAAENQATDRAHRIGQDKAVFVYKLIAAGTVEERILAMQADKAELADAVLSESLDGATGALRAEDLLGLFEAL
ncbi:MAG: DEAD/DEAH box helicase [Burkholderiaceae bacterium]